LEPWDAASLREIQAELHEEILLLPRGSRTAIVLCDLEGHSCRAAAAQLGWPIRRIEKRLARARGLLEARMAERGITISTTRGVAGFLREARSVVSSRLIESTVAVAALMCRRTGQAIMPWDDLADRGRATGTTSPDAG
jgi:hypothetical protein